jgi:hypothetical protein
VALHTLTVGSACWLCFTGDQLGSIAIVTDCKDLRDVQSKRFDLLDRIQAARDVLNRIVMVAPVSGKVVNLIVHTRGAMIKPGETVTRRLRRGANVRAQIPAAPAR